MSALEDLTAQEAASLELGDFAAAIEIQDRAQPLVDDLVGHGVEITSLETRARILALLARRNRTGERLSEQLERAKEELRQTRVSQRRVAQVAPVYSVAGANEPRQLSAVG